MTDKVETPNLEEIFEKVTSSQKAEGAGGLAALQRFLKGKQGSTLTAGDVEFLERLECRLLSFLQTKGEEQTNKPLSLLEQNNSAENQQQSLHGAFASCFVIISALVDLQNTCSDTVAILKSQKHKDFINELVNFGFTCIFVGDFDLKLQWISG